MKAIVKIYQIKDVENTIYTFSNYREGDFDFNDYEEVAAFRYNEEKTVIDVLDKIFDLGNSGTLKQLIPTMRSVSVSDIIEVNGMRFYVENTGFKALEKVEA